ncbi:non-specific ribonucleoside hydrolase RihC-like [Colletes gigas]|uniref:non-specific ribonucleoside hydrolase RihC-like n=1 Tax=Colletes gigas TaxID=935657 RepID=UPI001C9B1E07|nr:non-specific ribonucleoside hydrolase RihC-like [Colletes gigas]XP_043261088.1 non-specific ribonucleoside hydrolase RihC-like [Colletes gigas]
MKIYTECIAIIFFCLVIGSVRSNNVKQKVIIDTDAGADDAAAILLILKSKPKEFEVIAITCSYGNTYVDNVVENVLKILTVANRSDIPVYKGVQKALLKEYKPTNFFGSDGLGDFNFTEKIIAKLDNTKHAAVALVDLVNQYPDEITILSIGPSTNIATAVALDPLVLKHLKSHIILGSSVSGIGNVSPNVEFNFDQDPESNYIVLNNTAISTIFPWETVINSVSADWRINTLGKINSTIMNFLNNAESKTILRNNEWHPGDVMAAAVMIWPELIKTFIIRNVSPVVDGMARGTVLVDYTNSTGKPKNAKIIQSFNTTAFQEVLLEAFS